MAKVRLPPIGFWSYVRRDDERLDNKISELRELVLAELETQIGDDVPVFKDTISIPNGERWEELTVKALGDATFFIPILTPAFLRSEWCCREVRLFLDREQALFATYPDLPKRSRIFPIHYVEVDEDADTADEAIRDTLMQLQHFSFQKKRNLRYDEPEVRDFIAGFVADIRKLLKLWVEEPERPPPPPPPPAPARPAKSRPKATLRPGVPVAPPPPPPSPPPRSPVRADGDDEWAAARTAAAAGNDKLMKTVLWAAVIGVFILIVAVVVGRSWQGPYVYANNMTNEAVSNEAYGPCVVDSYSSECLNSMEGADNRVIDTSSDNATDIVNATDNAAGGYYDTTAHPLDSTSPPESNTVGM